MKYPTQGKQGEDIFGTEDGRNYCMGMETVDKQDTFAESESDFEILLHVK